MKNLISASVVLVGVLLSTIIFNKSGRNDYDNLIEHYSLHPENVANPDNAIESFVKVLQQPTVGDRNRQNHIGDVVPFQRLHDVLKKQYATAFKTLNVEKINQYSLLMTWKGTDPTLKPIILISHLDVVPATNLDNWTFPPFAGTIDKNGFIYSRGALDTKLTVSAILEAVCQLITAKFTPQRSLILAFGHDEELGGANGAQALSLALESRNIQPELVLDEGGMLLKDGVKPFYRHPVAIVGTSEKGTQSWEISVTGQAGHSSIPPTGLGTSTAARISRILARIESELTPTKLESPTTDFLRELGRITHSMPLSMIASLADTHLFNPILSQLLGQYGGKDISALVRTTVAVVGIHAGGDARNVLPSSGNITINLRTLPGEDDAFAASYVQGILIHKEGEYASARKADGMVDAHRAAPVSPSKGPLWDLIVRSIQETFDSRDLSGGGGGDRDGGGFRPLPVIPYMFTGMSDSRWYHKIAHGRVYRFSPFKIHRGKGELSLLHGIDERIHRDDYLDGVKFFIRFSKLSLLASD